MKKNLQVFLLFSIVIFCVSPCLAQKSLIHYWNFDNTPTAHITPATPAIPDIAPAYSVITSPAPRVTYYLLPGTSLTASDRYIDPNPGTDSNARYSVVPTGAGGNQSLRLRNPLDSMELRIFAPTTGYTGIIIKYALQSSSVASGDSTDIYDYSVDGGTTWKNGKANGMKVNGSNVDTLNTTPDIYISGFATITIDLSADKTVENNPNFVFRVRFKGNASLAKGNNRFDNLTFEGDKATQNQSLSLIHYWNFDNTPTAHITPATPSIPDIPSSFSAVSTPKALVRYYLLPGTSLTAFDRYVDPYTGVDSINARFSVVPTGSGGNFSLRLRNPIDSMELRIFAPTTGFTGIVMKYALQSSSTTNGDSVDWFDYSVDGGTTWKSGLANGMKVNGRLSDTVSTLWNTYQGDVNWGLVTVDLSADASVNNNPNFVMRIRFLGGANHTSGNNRLDNMTFEGIGGSGSLPATITVKQPGNSGILVAGRHTTVAFDTANNVGITKTIEYSIDGGTTWSSVGTTSGTTYDWIVPNTPTANGMIRVQDAEGTVGKSSLFTIIVIDPKTNTVIHYWDFNSLTKVYSNPNIPTFPSDFSANESTPGSLVYTLEPGTSSTYKGYIDNVAGDTGNAQFGVPAGQALRVRNPTDSMELRFMIPTAGFKDISFSYVIEESSNISPLVRHFDYSVDGGNNWITTGLSMTTESNLDSTKFDPVKLNFASGSPAENNANLIFRIKMTGGLNSGTSGNNRYDNIVVEGTTTADAVTSNQKVQTCSINPNPANTFVMLLSPDAGMKEISIFDVTGKLVLKTVSSGTDIPISISSLSPGMYSVHIQGINGNEFQVVRFVKE